MDIDLRNKIALVTGGSGQIGRTIVRTLASCGASMVINYFNKDEEKAKELLEELKALGTKAMIVNADVTELDSVMVMKDKVNKILGDPEIIVNNAYSRPKFLSIMDESLEEYENQFKSCVIQNVLMAKVFVPAMIKNRYGRIIAINTECIGLNEPEQSAYVSGKKGMDGLLRVLAKEVGEYQITVNQVAPGWTITERDRPKGSEREKIYENRVILKRRGTDQEVANVVSFIASNLASFITGAYIPVSGGIVMPAV